MNIFTFISFLLLSSCWAMQEETNASEKRIHTVRNTVNSSNTGTVSEDTGYDTRTTTSSQSSIHVEVGTLADPAGMDTDEDTDGDLFAPGTPAADAGSQGAHDVQMQVDPGMNSAPQLSLHAQPEVAQSLIEEIDALYWATSLWTPGEVTALGDLKSLAIEKRIFERHAAAWMKKHLKMITPQKQNAITKQLSYMIKNSDNNYFIRKRSLKKLMFKMGTPKHLIKRFNKTVLRKHEESCKNKVSWCAQSIKAFDGIDGVPDIQYRKKVLPDGMVRIVLGNIKKVLTQ